MGFSDRTARLRGDTIIEVMFATAVGGMVIVLAMSVMNRGVATTQAAVEHTMVRQSMDGQAEALRFLRDNKTSLDAENTSDPWQQIVARAENNPEASEFGEESCEPSDAQDFYLDTGDVPIGDMVRADPSGLVADGAAFASPGRGLWIEPVSTTARSYVDFHVRACWDPPFNGPKMTLGTIVRLPK